MLQNIVLLGIGNILCKDEGIGVEITRRLKELALPEDVSVVEGGVLGLSLIDIVSQADHLIVVDALRGGDEPGAIYRIEEKDLPKYAHHFKTAHDVGIMECLELSSLVGKKPETTIIGIEPKEISMGMELSKEVEEKIPKIIELVLEEIKRCTA